MKVSLFTPLIALVSIVTICGATPQGSSNPAPSYVGVPPAKADNKITDTFEVIRSDISKLLQIFSASNPKTKPDFQPAEQNLMRLGKHIDSARKQLDMYPKTLGSGSANLIASDLQDSVRDVKKIVQGIISMANFFHATQTDTLVVTILRALEPGFHGLYKSLSKKLPANAKQTVAPMILDIICQMDKAIEALQPGNGLCTPDFCKTYDTHDKHDPDYSKCPDNDFPDMPKPTPCFDACEQSCSSLLKFGYENNCYDGIGACDAKNWCDKSGDVPFSPCTDDWTPQPWFCHPTVPKKHRHGSYPNPPPQDNDSYGGGKTDGIPSYPNNDDNDSYGSGKTDGIPSYPNNDDNDSYGGGKTDGIPSYPDNDDNDSYGSGSNKSNGTPSYPDKDSYGK